MSQFGFQILNETDNVWTVCSIAIMTDAVHELSDALNYAVAIYATILTSRQSTISYTFGYHRAETIGALINVVSICVLSVTLVMQAIERLVHPEPIDGKCASGPLKILLVVFKVSPVVVPNSATPSQFAVGL